MNYKEHYSMIIYDNRLKSFNTWMFSENDVCTPEKVCN